MKKNLTKLFLVLVLVLQSCHSKNCDIIQVNHFYVGSGFHLKYSIHKNLLTVKTDCDLEDCKEEVVYERKISIRESREFISKLGLLELDTLKNEYVNNNVLDGQYTGYILAN